MGDAPIDPIERAFKNLRDEVHNVSITLGVQGVAQNIRSYDGLDKQKYREWIREIEKHRVMMNMNEGSCIMLAYQTSKGAVSGFIERFRAGNPNADWRDLKTELARRFSDIADCHTALTMLRQIKQRHGESLNLYAERILGISGEAFEDEQAPGVQAQLIDIFVTGLSNDQLKMTILRKNPDTVINAIGIATSEANLRTRVAAISGRGSTIWEKPVSRQSQKHEAMDVDHSRDLKCFKCGIRGHKARACRKVVQSVTQGQFRRPLRCYNCGQVGHIARECRREVDRKLN